MPPRSPKKPVCVACNDTGVSSKGKPCRPCELAGRLPLSAAHRIKPTAKPSPKKPSLWE